ncbi:MAG: hypothetical protein II054_03495 [Treponema sp.]|nr:hypothetical protein [Treponema sp.]
MANRCPSCGGTLRFDIQKQKLVCEYCESEFAPDSIAEMGGAGESEAFGSEPESETMDAKIFTCPNCGAEVFATDLDAVEYCSYCGTFVTLESRLAKLQKPSYILPFTITKEKCLELYKEKLKKTHFLPKDMQANNAENMFRNTYIPFWVYTEKMNPDASVKFSTTESWRSGNTEYTQHYDISAKPEGTVDGIFFDASATLDDRISEQIGNFSLDSLQPYNSSLMTGSYADVADVEKNVYEDDVRKKGEDAISNAVASEINSQDRFSSDFRHHSSVSHLNSKNTDGNYSNVDAKLAMLPVWFMTWKNKDRLCYSVINGNTGKMFAEIPADLKKYTLVSLLLSLPIFAIFNFCFTFMPGTILLITAVLTAIMFFTRMGVLKKLNRQENRMDDKGFQRVFAAQEGQSSQTERSASNESSEKEGKKKVSLSGIPSIIALAVTAFLIYKKYPNDLYYYIGVFLNILSTFVSVASVVKAHNLSCSRPIPHFFDKSKEAGK